MVKLNFVHVISIVFLLAGIGCSSGKKSKSSSGKLSVLIVTGGHEFEREAFFAMFDSFDRIAYHEVVHPQADNVFTDGTAAKYDVLVFYDMYQEITAEQKAAFIDLLKKGKGIVVLHHALASYQAWPEFEKIVGGKYFLQPHMENGREVAGSTFKHGQDIPVHVVNLQHPVTKGIPDFRIHDEVYGGFSVSENVEPLLSTEHPLSGKIIAWAHKYDGARVVTVQLGHDHSAYENPNYRRLIKQAIMWVASR